MTTQKIAKKKGLIFPIAKKRSTLSVLSGEVNDECTCFKKSLSKGGEDI